MNAGLFFRLVLFSERSLSISSWENDVVGERIPMQELNSTSANPPQMKQWKAGVL
jgi:hypothetical protein